MFLSTSNDRPPKQGLSFIRTATLWTPEAKDSNCQPNLNSRIVFLAEAQVSEQSLQTCGKAQGLSWQPWNPELVQKPHSLSTIRVSACFTHPKPTRNWITSAKASISVEDFNSAVTTRPQCSPILWKIYRSFFLKVYRNIMIKMFKQNGSLPSKIHFLIGVNMYFALLIISNHFSCPLTIFKFGSSVFLSLLIK